MATKKYSQTPTMSPFFNFKLNTSKVDRMYVLRKCASLSIPLGTKR